MAVGGKRHAARELALKMLFQVELGRIPVAEVLHEFAPDEEIGEPPAESIAFAHDLVRGTAQNLPRIDWILAAHTEEWAYDRLAATDRAILRLAVYEMLFDNTTPEEIVINEAVELAKEYSTEESGKFVNGILGKLSRERAAGTLQLEEPAAEEQEEPPAKSGKRKRQPLRMGQT